MPALISSRLRRRRLRLPRLRSLSEKILREVGKPRAGLSLLIVGDRSMRRLNRRYRGKDRTTDVLAFPMRTGSSRVTRHASPVTSSLLGDIVISLPQAERQARQAGHSLDREITVLVIHGLLHLLGYDHERSAREARRMARREALVLRRLGRLPRLAGRSR
jgi:rRNA maturation RNase YbeY